MYRRILVGYDGSAAGRKAFEMALARRAARRRAACHFGRKTFGDRRRRRDRSGNRAFARLPPPLARRAKASAATKQVKAHYEVAVGHPAEQLIYYADRTGADLIVVGDRGRSNFARLLLGSVSKQVTEHAGRPVLVVR